MSIIPNEILLVEIELLSKTLLHCITPNNMHALSRITNVMHWTTSGQMFLQEFLPLSMDDKFASIFIPLQSYES